MRIYLAARYDRRQELCLYAAELKKLGHVITSRWLAGEFQMASDDSTPIGEDMEKKFEDGKAPADIYDSFAGIDAEDVTSADLLIAFTESEETIKKEKLPTMDKIPAVMAKWARGGRHVELGIAIAKKLAIIVVGPRENLFCWLKHIYQVDTFDKALELIPGNSYVLYATDPGVIKRYGS